ncbi:hypothetical protein [Streptomyces johnsoniae]|uniref:DUF1918 domain-containing protein n=1 Tax=Streptomyces johnsoniae TaxID=3075532 RepID=A0ABU2S2X5_9ACTN|nr:hypothetical protein [Streptomyces sp. DSM 41886]MDT0443353.1 hypothetical protein [Streptomyces sp. DSM 41886]
MSDEKTFDVGSVARDTSRNTVGRAMAYPSGRAWLRPLPGGGREWHVRPEDMEAVAVRGTAKEAR